MLFVNINTGRQLLVLLITVNYQGTKHIEADHHFCKEEDQDWLNLYVVHDYRQPALIYGLPCIIVSLYLKQLGLF